MTTKPKKVVLKAKWNHVPRNLNIRGATALYWVSKICPIGRRLLRAFGTDKDRKLRITIEEV